MLRRAPILKAVCISRAQAVGQEHGKPHGGKCGAADDERHSIAQCLDAEDAVNEARDDLSRDGHLHGVRGIEIAPSQDRGRARTLRGQNNRRDGIVSRVAMKMEAVDIGVSSAIEFDNAGGSHDIAVGRALGQNTVLAVADARDHPRCLDIDKDGLVVGGAGRGQHPHNVEFKRVDAVQIEEVLRSRDNRVARTEPEPVSDARVQNSLAEQGDLATFGNIEPAKIEAFQRSAHDPRAVRLECGIDRDWQAQPAFPDRFGFRHCDGVRPVVGEIERVHNQV